MATQIPLRCRCGRVRGLAVEVSPTLGNRVICYCDDCQAFARFLDRPDALDAWGGTDIFQAAPCRVKITEGAGELACVRLSSKGLYRWYTACCKTPVANTIGAGVPLVSLIHSFMDHEGDGRFRDSALGPPIAYIMGAFAVGNPPAHVRDKPSFRSHPLKIGRLMLGWWIGRKGRPSPFFDADGAPTAPPRVLSASEREAL